VTGDDDCEALSVQSNVAERECILNIFIYINKIVSLGSNKMYEFSQLVHRGNRRSYFVNG
jgi:hypothetical protein